MCWFEYPDCTMCKNPLRVEVAPISSSSQTVADRLGTPPRLSAPSAEFEVTGEGVTDYNALDEQGGNVTRAFCTTCGSYASRFSPSLDI